MTFAHRPRKRFGQHFLIDHRIIQKIVSAINPKEDDQLIEIGPGRGALTKFILSRVAKLTVVELDRDLILGLKLLASDAHQIEVINEDVLNYDFSELTDESHTLRIVGNLPYNISTPLIFHLLDHKAVIKDMHFMLQKEVVDRLVATVGEKDYSRLGVMVQYHCQVQHLFDVSRHAFQPPPKVESAVVRLIPHNQLPYPAKDYQVFADVVRHAFMHRRKTIRNCLKDMISANDLVTLNIDPSLRPEQISLPQYVVIANKLV